jgi:prepilin-type N-terminal cleavage/methylation domain-containing protein
MTGNRIENRPLPTRQGGFTLIEILIVLIILLIGVFAILRIIAGGFPTIHGTAQATDAGALSAQQLDAAKQQFALEDAHVSIDPSFGSINSDVQPDLLPDLTSAVSPNFDPYYLSNINIFRHIIGESFRVSIPTSNSGQGYGAIYMLQYGPVFNQFGMDAGGNPSDSLAVYGSPLERTEQSSMPSFNNSDATPILMNEAQYAIDYDKLMIAFYPRLGTKSRKFTLSYDYFIKDANMQIAVVAMPNSANTVITVPDVDPITVPQGQQPRAVWQKLFKDMTDPNGMVLPANFDPILKLKQNSEDVSRKFRLVTTNTVAGGGGAPGFTPDPYEYAWYSEQKSSNANVGVLLFNPIGHNLVTQTTNGPQPLVARVDYTSFDNHIIREDRSVPNGAPYDIRLTLPNILINGAIGTADPKLAIYDTITTYTGMFRDTVGTATPDLLIYNANTGEKVDELINGVSSNGVIELPFSDRAGIVRLKKSVVESMNLQSASLRFFYRAEGEWGMQVQKANAHYTQAATPGTVDYKSFYVGFSDAAQDGIQTRIYFPLCEAGKTVVLGEFFVTTNLAAPNNRLRFANETYQINADSAQFTRFGNTVLTWIDLKSQHDPDASGQAWSWDYTQTGRAVNNVRGASLRSRVIWKSATRWRKVDNDTFLNQSITR